MLTDFTPVPRLRNRDDGWSAQRQRDLVTAIACYGSVRAACNALYMSERGAYELRMHPEAGEFRAAWDLAVTEGLTILEDIAWDRAINGTEQVIMYQGERVAMRTQYDNRLLTFMLRARRPDVYGQVSRTARPQPGDKLYQQMRAEWEAECEADKAARNEESMRATEAKIASMRERLLQNHTGYRVRIMVDTPEFAEKYRDHFPEEYKAAMEIIAVENNYDMDGNRIGTEAQVPEQRHDGDEGDKSDAWHWCAGRRGRWARRR